MTAFRIEFRSGTASRILRPQVAERLQAAVRPLPIAPTSVRATFTDENGPKGGEAIRCALEVRLPRRAAIHVEGTAATSRLAFDAAVAKLARQLDKTIDVKRELRRRPKKYYAARRALLS